MSFSLALTFGLAAAAHSVQAASTNPADPDYERPVAGYVPVVSAALIFAVLFGLLTIGSWIHYFRHRRFILILPISFTAMCCGMVLRIIYHGSPYSVGVYAISMLLILLSPCGFLATSYTLLGRMANHLGAQDCLLIRTSLITKLFVSCDVVTFLLQAAGSGSQVAGGSFAKIGHYIALAGLIAQLVSFALFCVLLVVFGMRLRSHHPLMWSRKEGKTSFSPMQIFSRRGVDDWKVVFYTSLLACIGLFVRCVFRCIEYSQGFDGYLATTEVYAYALDSAPLFLCMAPFVYFWPAKYLPVQPTFATELVYGQNDIEGSPAAGQMEMKRSPAGSY